MKTLLFTVFAALLFSCSDSSAKKENVTVIFTCDTQGRLEPCGCFSGQYGGLSRISTFIKKLNNDITVRVDAGDSAPGSEDYDLIQYKYVLQAFKKMNFDALNCGVREASLDLTELKNLLNTKNRPEIISANLLSAQGEQVFPPFIRFKRGSKNIAILGVVDENLSGESLGKGLMVDNMETAIGRQLSKIKDDDFKILLAFTDENQLRKLAEKFFEFDLILGGKVRQPSMNMLRENKSTILYTTNQAKNVGFVQGTLADKTFHPEKYDIPLLFEKVPEDPEILAYTKLYRDEVKKTALEIDSPGKNDEEIIGEVKPLATFVGSESCAGCHPTAHNTWAASAHAKAFETLKLKESSSDPKCIKCHTVGFGEQSGYQRKFLDTKMVNVGCESCHGPGSEHIRQRASGLKALFNYRPVGEGDCKSCHHGEFSRPFKWDEMWPLIIHGKESAK